MRRIIEERGSYSDWEIGGVGVEVDFMIILWLLFFMFVYLILL
jgi:hypothetical protein